VPASTRNRHGTISSSLLREKRARTKKKNSSEHEPPLRTEVDLSEGAAPDLAAEAELVPDPGFHYSRNSPKEKKEKNCRENAPFSAAEI
jgi:hypothetical protein